MRPQVVRKRRGHGTFSGGTIGREGKMDLQENRLSPSILSADFWRLGEQIEALEAAGVPWLHIDVMDGLFVPSISYGMPLIRSIRGRTDLFFDVHLMIERPERYIEAFAESGADLINFHLEATKQPQEVIRRIRAVGKKAGITIRPDTPARAVEPWLELADLVLVMTVEPGFAGQKLIPACVEKLSEIRRMVRERGLSVDIEADGGINLENVERVTAAGANVIVAGSAIFKNDMDVNIRRFLDKIK